MRKVRVPIGDDVRQWKVLHGTTIRYSKPLSRVFQSIVNGSADDDTLSVQASYLAECWTGQGLQVPSFRQAGGCVHQHGDIAADALLELGYTPSQIAECVSSLFTEAAQLLPNTKEREEEVKEAEAFTEAPGRSTQD